ncbi:uncharacterized protein LOC129724699 [Wyeomyia smithii]|uniref:uncharacterized protein LOC129724699 n=1 Tax=Wyeomyia smithii TaxID=174621 RepID=UPI002467D608|nr:uncharacterized protein LOC129724699 [Wyeomyia smithii]
MSSNGKISNLKHELQNVKELLHCSEMEKSELKAAIKEMALGKQYLTNELCATQMMNTKLAKRIDKQRDYFQRKDATMQRELKQIKSSLQSMQRSLHLSNGKLARHMRHCAGTRYCLGAMFLRMRSTKLWHEKRRDRYQQVCFQFAEYVREQNRYMEDVAAVKLSYESITTCHRQYLDLLTRCSQLLHENMNLRLLSLDGFEKREEYMKGKFNVQKVDSTGELESDKDDVASGTLETTYMTTSKSTVRQRSSSV